MPDLVPTLLFGLTLLLVVGIGEALRAMGVRPEDSRRFVHAATGIAVALCPPFFSEPTGIYALAVLFVGVNVVAVRRKLFLGMHGIERETWGTVAFPLALIAALFLCWTLDPGRIYILQTAFLVLAVSDPLAAWVGGRVSRGQYEVNGQTKTLAGSLAFVTSAGILAAFGIAIWRPDGIGLEEILAGAVLVAGLGGTAEALGTKGWDNLWMVLAVVVALVALDGQPEVAVLLLSAFGVAVAFAAVSYFVGFLDLSGAMAAGLLAWGVVGLGPLTVGAWGWAAIGFTFFFGSSVLSKLGRRRKREAETRAAKGSRRDAGQVAANGGVAGLLLAATPFATDPEGAMVLFLGWCGAFAAASADTWSTEIGTWVRGQTRDVLRWRPVPPGESGGVSLAGSLGGALGAALIAGLAVLFLESASLGAVVLTAGLVGAWADSLLGATVQARFLAPDGSLTEKPEADGVALPLARGWRWMTNDRVNLACTLVGAMVPLVVLWLF
ncbi:MAG: DUF92 domain-containing protein [Bacteroidota bacterium]